LRRQPLLPLGERARAPGMLCSSASPPLHVAACRRAAAHRNKHCSCGCWGRQGLSKPLALGCRQPRAGRSGSRGLGSLLELLVVAPAAAAALQASSQPERQVRKRSALSKGSWNRLGLLQGKQSQAARWQQHTQRACAGRTSHARNAPCHRRHRHRWRRRRSTRPGRAPARGSHALHPTRAQQHQHQQQPGKGRVSRQSLVGIGSACRRPARQLASPWPPSPLPPNTHCPAVPTQHLCCAALHCTVCAPALERAMPPKVSWSTFRWAAIFDRQSPRSPAPGSSSSRGQGGVTRARTARSQEELALTMMIPRDGNQAAPSGRRVHAAAPHARMRMRAPPTTARMRAAPSTTTLRHNHLNCVQHPPPSSVTCSRSRVSQDSWSKKSSLA
jgi:hypothetical protein